MNKNEKLINSLKKEMDGFKSFLDNTMIFLTDAEITNTKEYNELVKKQSKSIKGYLSSLNEQISLLENYEKTKTK